MRLIERLECEWRTLIRRGQLDTAYERWAERHSALVPYAGPDDAVRALRDPSGGYTQRDAAFRALVTEARRDVDAGCAVLQALVPALRASTRRLPGLGAAEAEATVVAAAWECITRYPLAARPQHIAANIVYDLRKLARRDALSRPTTVQLTCLEDDEQSDPGRELAEVLVDAVHEGVIGADAARLIFRTRILDDQLVDLAANVGVAYPTLRQRRLRAERALVTAVTS